MHRQTLGLLLLLSPLAGCGTKLTAVTDSNFESLVVESDKPVLLDCWATWCGPCKVLAPTIDEIADEYGDRVLVAKMDVDVAGKIAQQFNIRSIPTVLIFNNGQVISRRVGIQPKGNYTSDLEKALKTAPTR